ncbi:MAG: DegT/DnrJ/EryC1/StrS aminotransferase family protein [Candidatus Omnitrophica bacterium]|nr:DegT/DnrJ/EryC1/StrS aminotransferase family protein [Candidatus Omnitrophota bacterium]
MTAPMFYSWEPRVTWRDLGVAEGATWDTLDRCASELLGAPAVAIPSVRVGLCWMLEYLGLRRHADDVLVPNFLGRCILNQLNRQAMPVRSMTDKTRLVIVVHQFGFAQRLAAIQAECGARAVPYIEDSPYGLSHDERVGEGSLARFIGFSKILPVLKGGAVLSEDLELRVFIRAKRLEANLWSWPLLVMLAWLRHRRFASSYALLGDVASELYVQSGSDNAWLRGQMLRVLRGINEYERIACERLSLIERSLKGRAWLPDCRRLAYVVPVPANESDEEEMARVFEWHHCDCTRYHFDINRNLFNPEYRRVFLIPLNPWIPAAVFEALVHELARVCRGRLQEHMSMKPVLAAECRKS